MVGTVNGVVLELVAVVTCSFMAAISFCSSASMFIICFWDAEELASEKSEFASPVNEARCCFRILSMSRSTGARILSAEGSCKHDILTLTRPMRIEPIDCHVAESPVDLASSPMAKRTFSGVVAITTPAILCCLPASVETLKAFCEPSFMA